MLELVYPNRFVSNGYCLGFVLIKAWSFHLVGRLDDQCTERYTLHWIKFQMGVQSPHLGHKERHTEHWVFRHVNGVDKTNPCHEQANELDIEHQRHCLHKWPHPL